MRIAFLFAVLVGTAAVAFAQTAVPELNYVPPASHGVDWHAVADCAGIVGFLSALLANVVSPDTALGRLLHFAALNGPKLQQAIRDRPKPL